MIWNCADIIPDRKSYQFDRVAPGISIILIAGQRLASVDVAEPRRSSVALTGRRERTSNPLFLMLPSRGLFGALVFDGRRNDGVLA